jgi:Flp pilus assembly protein CpaB
MLAPLSLLRTARRQVLIRRRTLAALCAGLAVWFGLGTVRAAPPETVVLLTAAHDLDSGATLGADDLRRTRFSPDSVPDAAVRDPDAVVGRSLLVPLGRGQAVTTGQLLGKSVLAGYPDRAAIGMRIPDRDAAALLEAGDRVDLVASDPQGEAEPERLVRDAVVLALPASDPDAAGVAESSGRLVLFAVPRNGIERVAATANSHYLSIIWTR